MTREIDESLKGSATRLWSLIAARLQPGADVQAIDRRIWDLFGEDWTVVFTDLSGFSRQVAKFGIVHFLQVIYEQKRLLLPIIAARDGILVKIEADSFLVLFKRPEVAAACAVEMQRACQQLNLRRVAEEKVLLCVGIGFGRVLRIGDTDVFGAEVNAASKLGEDTARADEILVTEAVRAALEAAGGWQLEPLGVEVPGSKENFRLRYDVVADAPGAAPP